MNMLKPFAVVMLLAASTLPGYAQTQVAAADCEALFTKADTNADGSVGGDEAKLFTAKLSGDTAQTKEAGIFSKEEFMGFCTSGVFAGVEIPAAQ